MAIENLSISQHCDTLQYLQFNYNNYKDSLKKIMYIFNRRLKQIS